MSIRGIKRKFITFTGVLALGAALSLGAVAAVSAASPPAPPARFVGTVMVNGSPATPGTAVEAHIGSATCGVTTVFMSGTDARYTIDSPALDPSASPNCGTDGATVAFYVGGVKANETGTWHSYQLNTVNLTVGGATPTAAASSTPTATVTPGAPVTGSGVASSGSVSLVWIAGALALVVVGGGGAALALARRRA